ncbi:50S ribosomal protein L36 [Corynebacterium pseudotuberculosis]|nr:50S ribosomal protein L36 [Corynebacterium pseudotuberculosis PAT10]AFF22829.1 50S ribosomal protein L36 [Corynebacterium pseudotuberculosis P54B96]AKP09300.1 50S ribosomal protein L36 [Corynebacterium pseudotuberculosis]ALM77536.1 50S ribosomal protein L36 [Corynebacterium pseudotuberculosis]ALP34333.1 50S ribosomal protein L36 [Corynebacterium pseudotuberculosis]
MKAREWENAQITVKPLYGFSWRRKERPMKVRKSLRSLKNKPGAQVVRRRGKVYVINKKDPRFKARQG